MDVKVILNEAGRQRGMAGMRMAGHSRKEHDWRILQKGEIRDPRTWATENMGSSRRRPTKPSTLANK